jgi:hypothetical protein
MRVNFACSSVAASLSSSWLALLCVACHFNAQPLFEPQGENIGDSSQLPGMSAAPDAQPPAAPDAAPAADGGERPSAEDDAGDPITSGQGMACTPDEASACDGAQLLLCAADGSAIVSRDCGGAGCNGAAKRCNSCRPNALSCSGSKLLRCDAEGGANTEELCPMGCIATRPGEAACRKCAEGPPACQDNNLVQCAPDGQSSMTTQCPRGCDDATHTCSGTLVPTNIPKDACSWTDLTATDRDIEGMTDLDTERDCPRVIRQGSGLPDLCVLAFERLRVRRDATLHVTGNRALVLVATRSMEIEGRLSVSAREVAPGPGSLRATDAAGRGEDAVGRVPPGMMLDEWTPTPANAGGGGAGHLTPGAAGGAAVSGSCGPMTPCAEPGRGGAAYGAERLVPLQGGSTGGMNSAREWSTRRQDGGGGGGALQLVACQELRLSKGAVLDANGGGGEGGGSGTMEMDSDTPGAGAGGGSGGAILVQARVLRVDEGALIVANGGGGGGGATRSGAGSTQMIAGETGHDGQLSEAAAAGGKGAGDSQAGGLGGAKDPPTEGGRARLRTLAAGGGGGAAGRIRIETAAQPGPRAGLVVSPPATYGTVAVE